MSDSTTPFVSSEVETPRTAADFLLELRSEEIPARMQAGARADLEKLFRREMEAAGLAVGALTLWSTPRRLTLIARDLPLSTKAVSEETKGPRTSAPEQALEGFLRKTGLTRDQLTERDGVWFAVVEKPGRAAADVLAEAIPNIIRAFPWPKSQRWGAASLQPESLRWVRPLSGIVALLGDDLIECEIGGVRSGYATMGHRFHHHGEITIGNAADYAAKLRAAHVIVDHAEREAIVRDGARKAAADAGLVLVEDEGLVIENAGLTEWPVPLLGRFDEAFLEVPPEVIQLTARVNQKYFICRDSAGKLANAFVCTANIVAKDGGAMIVAGNRKVLAARLSDARFFWEQDRKTPLSVHAEKLGRITFHEKLGTVADKVKRVARLAEWLASEGIVPDCNPAQARLAAELCKADLVTEMVGEFPELQGLMGGYYARAEGLPDAVADAIRDHYKPVGQGDDVPTAPVTVAVALADKLDTLAGFFAVGLLPTGSKDPFALRRQMLAIINIVDLNRIRLPFHTVVMIARNLVVKTFGLNRWITIASDHGDGLDFIRFVRDDVEFMDDVIVYPYEASQYPDNDIRDELVWSDHYDSGKSPPVKFESAESTADSLVRFMFDRLRVRLRDEGIRHDVIDALMPRVTASERDRTVNLLLDEISGVRNFSNQIPLRPTDNIVLINRAARALNEVIETRVGKDALHAYRRAARFLLGAEVSSDLADVRVIGAPEEMMTMDSWVSDLEVQLEASLALRDIPGAIAAIAAGRETVDAFCDNVTVNDADPAKRASRLALLDRFRAAVHKVADFSRIEG